MHVALASFQVSILRVTVHETHCPLNEQTGVLLSVLFPGLFSLNPGTLVTELFLKSLLSTAFAGIFFCASDMYSGEPSFW